MLDGALIIVCNLRLLITLRHCNCPSLISWCSLNQMSPSVFVWNKHFKRSIPGGKNTDLTEDCAKNDLSRSNSQQSALSWNWISSTRHNICKRFPAYYINITDMKPHLYSWRVRSRGHLVRRKWWAQNIVDLPIASAENHSSKTVLLLLSLVKMGLDNLSLYQCPHMSFEM